MDLGDPAEGAKDRAPRSLLCADGGAKLNRNQNRSDLEPERLKYDQNNISYNSIERICNKIGANGNLKDLPPAKRALAVAARGMTTGAEPKAEARSPVTKGRALGGLR